MRKYRWILISLAALALLVAAMVARSPGAHAQVRATVTANAATLEAIANSATPTMTPSPTPNPQVVAIETLTAQNALLQEQIAQLLAAAPVSVVQTRTMTITADAPREDCRDGEVVGNVANFIDRTPVGLKGFNSISEVAWKPGSGFAGWDRIVLVIPDLGTQYQVFVLNVGGGNLTRYCGAITDVEAYALDLSGHVWASRASSADAQGRMPTEDEIGVYAVDFSAGTMPVLKALKVGSTAPQMAAVASHIQIVRLSAAAVAEIAESQPMTMALEVVEQGEEAAAAPTAQPAIQPTAVPAATAQPAASGTCAWTQQQVPYSWDNPSQPTIEGPGILNFGRPGTDANDMFRLGIPDGMTIKTKINIGGSFFPYAGTGCDLSLIMQESANDAGGLQVINPQQGVDQGLIEILPAG